MEEYWKDVVGYEDLYLVSNLGRIKTLYKRKYGSIINVYINQQGYCFVRLNKNKKRTGLLLHRLVAKAFIPNPENKPQVNHKDGNKQNNKVDNLEWVTSSENMKHSWNNNLMSYNTYNSFNNNHKGKTVLQLDIEGNLINTYTSLTEASKTTGIKSSNISACCLNKQRYKTAGGYVWKYN